jgi:anti-anti-sigma factor
MAEFSITTQTMTSQSAIVRMGGVIDDLAFDLLEDEFSKILESGVIGLILDFAKVENITSDSLGAILNLAHILKSRGGKLCVAAPSPEIRETIVMLGVDEQIGLEETPDAARKTVMAAIK